MSGRRQNNQLELAFDAEDRGEAPRAAGEGTEPLMADHDRERPVITKQLMEEVLEPRNLRKALKRVLANKGASGIDGMAVEELPGHLRQHWPAIRKQMLAGTYVPQPVRRVEIPKPGTGVRRLGIPTVLDRFIQQAVMRVLQRHWDRTMSQHSYGFRPGRSAHQAVAQAQQYVGQGNRWVVDMDLEKFFDQVNHDRLMSRIARRVTDKRVLKLIRAYLSAGVMKDGLVSPTREGTPQGGPLSPLLSNIVLDELDKELERRGHRFVRYADDCNIYVRSERAGHRVMKSITRFIERKLKLRVNVAKSAVDRPYRRKFLGFSFTSGKEPKRRVALEARARFKKRVREITRRSRGVSLERVVAELRRYLLGWRAYYGYCQTPTVLQALDRWTRRRLRCFVWKQGGRGRTRFRQFRRRGLHGRQAAIAAHSEHGPWHASLNPAINAALSNAYLTSLGLPSLASLRT